MMIVKRFFLVLCRCSPLLRHYRSLIVSDERSQHSVFALVGDWVFVFEVGIAPKHVVGGGQGLADESDPTVAGTFAGSEPRIEFDVARRRAFEMVDGLGQK